MKRIEGGWFSFLVFVAVTIIATYMFLLLRNDAYGAEAGMTMSYEMTMSHEMTMAHFANVRDISGAVVEVINSGDYVIVEGYDAVTGRIWIYDPLRGVEGTVAAVYLYGGDDYYYENPVYYPTDYSGLSEYKYEASYCVDYSAGSQNFDTYEVEDYSYVYDAVQGVTEIAETEDFYYNVWVDVDISEQIISVYSGEDIIFSTYCVTGTFNTTDTPVGSYYILNKETNAILRGDDYRVEVAYWMPFTPSGCGIHDAIWRYDFSRTAYLTNGSHGCVNVKYDVAELIYNLVDIGSAVIVHE